MQNLIRVAILDDHQSIIDGYLFRLTRRNDIIIVDYACCGEDLHQMLDHNEVDVLILDLHVPSLPEGKDSYPVLSQIPGLLDRHPRLNILVISIGHQPTLIDSVIEAGASGYILKEDILSIKSLADIVVDIAMGGFYLSPSAEKILTKKVPGGEMPSERQLQILACSAAYPEATSEELSQRLQIAPSTIRQLLSRAYYHLGVQNRTEAILRARQLGLFDLDHAVDA
jgi:DNA-binding NarL/FixJ family response regulator